MNPNFSVEESGVICRTCMCRTNGEVKSLFCQIDGDARTLSEVLSYVADVSVNEKENLPNQVCMECISNMRIADVFKRKCQNSEETLRRAVLTKGIIIEAQKEDNKLFCQDCTILFNNSDEFSKHVECHKNPYQCSVCLSRFAKWDTLEYHLTVSHSSKCLDVNKFECDNCEQMFQSRNVFQDHIKSCIKSDLHKLQEGTDTPLSDCGSSSASDWGSASDGGRPGAPYSQCKIEINLETLNIIHTSAIPNDTPVRIKRYTCQECNQKFDTKKVYKDHVQENHTTDLKLLHVRKNKKVRIASVLQTNNKERENVNKNTNNENSVLLEINKTENSDINLKKETDSVDEIETDNKTNLLPIHQCTMCARKFVKKASLQNHMIKHEAKLNEIHRCAICNREFKHNAHLINHMISVHVFEERLNCDFCSNTFSSEESLKLHLVKHKNQKKHRCDICNKAFNMLSTLKDHVRTHTGEKPYLCATCGRGFSQKTNLKEHMRRHLGYKPFMCSNCDQSFVTKGELGAHSRKHSGAHPFKCDTCSTGFTTSSSLVKHRRRHTGERPYVCDLCPLRFSALSTLKNHRRTHTGEKPFKCNFCEKAFAQKNDLVSHTRCHTGERPFVCTVCGQAFRQNSALKTHLKLHMLKDSPATALPSQLNNREMPAHIFTLDLTPLTVSSSSEGAGPSCSTPITENTK